MIINGLIMSLPKMYAPTDTVEKLPEILAEYPVTPTTVQGHYRLRHMTVCS